MANRNKPKHIKRVKFSVALPAWQRLYFPYVDASSNSSALVKLINYAVKHGAVAALSPQLPHGLTDPGELAAYLAAYVQPASAQVAPTAPTHTTAAPVEPLTPEQVAAMFEDWSDDEPDPVPTVTLGPKPAQVAAPAPARTTNAWDKPADQISEQDQRAIMQQIEAEMRAARGG